MATAGDRRDDDIRDLGRVAARFFDHVIVREDRNPRGRKRGETAALVVAGIREAMAQGARTQEGETILDEMEATRRALDIGQSGDLVARVVHDANAAWKQLH